MTLLAARLKTVMQISIIAAALTGLTASVMAVAEAIIKGDYSSAPKLDPVAETAVGRVIQWPASSGTLKLTSAQLNGCLQLGLNHTP